MWACLSLLITLCLLHGGGAESDGGGPRCQLPPAWKIGEVDPMKQAMGQVTVVALFQASWLFCLVQASRMDSLRQTLENQGLKGVVYMVINHQGEQSRRLHTLLAQRLTDNITLYQQDEQQPDVWQTLSGEKDDFFIYDRCGRLTHHISLPYSIIGQGHVENAIKNTYCKHICGDCTHQGTEILEECKEEADAQPDAGRRSPVEEATGHGHHHGHHHGHGHHGDNHDFHPHGFGHGHDHNHGHHHGSHNGHGHGHGQSQSQQGVRQIEHEQDGGVPQKQDNLDLGQMQQAVHMHQMPQEVDIAPVRPWLPQKARWKAKHSWQWTAGPDNEASPKSSWCWHWRRLFGNSGSEQPVSLWHCDEALPASWQWHGLTGDAASNVRETWQWRSPPADWQQPQPAQWAWPPGGSWGWEQL